tara:strand:+ start:657 stop:1472 length:816 start_codon:yes stop_codon:yes gene_type:complete
MLAHNHLGKNGRFGNQMFQYAATRGIAESHGYEFMIPDGPKTDDEFEDEENQHKLFMAFKMSGLRKLGMLKAPYCQESSFRFDADLFENCSDNVSLYGYFQSENWFAHIEDEIRQDFEFRDDVKNLCNGIYNEIVTEDGYTEAISLHVRRTDHLIKPTYHPVLPISYYEEALGRLPEDIPVFVFTDDAPWAFGHPFFESDRFFISENDNIVDMCLMSMCQYNIIANSTFSWWGAWLAGHDNVIAPKLWFGPDGEDPTDIYVDRWEYLDVKN